MVINLTEISTSASQLRDLLVGTKNTSEILTEEDWNRIIDLAQLHTVAPILYKRLKGRGINPPSEAAERLRQIYYANLKYGMRLFQEIRKILDALQAMQIPVIPIKGAYLAEAVYDNIALRPMTDIDLWVPRPQLAEACAVMQTLGYMSHSKASRPQALQDALVGERQFFKANAPLVELHWKIFHGEWIRYTTQIDEHVVWQRTMPLHGETVRQLSPEDAVIHLCVHLAVNHLMDYYGLRTLLDLDFARRKWNIDWITVAHRARSWRVGCATWLVLKTLADLFGNPEDQLRLLELAPSSIRKRLLSRFISTAGLMEGLKLNRGPKRFLYLLALVDRPADAAFLLWRAFFPERIWLTLRYGLQDAPAWRIWLHRLWHPLRVVITREV